LAPKNLGLKVGCFTENIYFNHSPVTIYKIPVKYPTIILFEVFEITKESGGKNEARLLKLIIALSQGSLHQKRT
jgi:hypothetical protein